jgi:AcrR family transcriptional regulator
MYARKQSSQATYPRARCIWKIVSAAFEAFVERGYAATSTLEIATRARVSKRELYALVGNKQKMMISLLLRVTERPSSGAIEARARDAAVAFLQLHPLPTGVARPPVRRRKASSGVTSF